MEQTNNQIIKMIEDNVVAFLANWKDLPDAEFKQDSSIAQLITGLPFAFLNSITNAILDGDNIINQIEEILTPFKENKLPILWWISPRSKPDNLDKMLENLNFRKIDEPPGMYMNLNNLDTDYSYPSEMTVKLVENEEDVKEWVEVFADGVGGADRSQERFLESELFLLEKQDYLRFTGYWKRKPVSTSAAILKNGVVGIYLVTTIPDYRGKGIGTAITIATLEDAKKRGYRDAILQSSPMGYNIYKRIGFEEFCKFKWYAHRFT